MRNLALAFALLLSAFCAPSRAQVGGTVLCIRETDGTPNVCPVQEIRATNGSLVDDGGGIVTLTNTGGVLSGLPSDPAACSAGQFATDQTINGVLTCSADPIIPTEIDTQSEFEALAGGLNYIVSTEIDTLGDIQTLAGGVNILDSTEVNTVAKIEALAGGANLLQSTELDSMGELEALVGGVNLIQSTEISTLAALEGLVGSSLISIQELDGSPSISPVRSFRVANGTLTDLGSGIASISTGAGGGSTNDFGSVTGDTGTASSDASGDTLDLDGGFGLSISCVTTPDTCFFGIAVTEFENLYYGDATGGEFYHGFDVDGVLDIRQTYGSDGSIRFMAPATLSGDKAWAANEVGIGNSGIAFEGSTANTSEHYVTADDPQEDVTYHIPWTKAVSSDVSTTSDTTYTAASALSTAIAANANYRATCRLVVGSAATTTGLQIQVTGPASPTQVTIERSAHDGSANRARSLVANAFQSGSTDDASADNCTGRCVDVLDLVIKNGTNSGTVAFGIQSEVNGSTVTLYQGSSCDWSRF